MSTYLVATGLGREPTEEGWTESLDNLWCDSEQCMTDVLRRLALPNDNEKGLAWAVQPHHNGPRYFLATYGAYPGGSETDYAVYCAACGDLMWEGLSDE